MRRICVICGRPPSACSVGTGVARRRPSQASACARRTRRTTAAWTGGIGSSAGESRAAGVRRPPVFEPVKAANWRGDRVGYDRPGRPPAVPRLIPSLNLHASLLGAVPERPGTAATADGARTRRSQRAGPARRRGSTPRRDCRPGSPSGSGRPGTGVGKSLRAMPGAVAARLASRSAAGLSGPGRC